MVETIRQNILDKNYSYLISIRNYNENKSLIVTNELKNYPEFVKIVESKIIG